MHIAIGLCRLELLTGDITEQKIDAIVNAANSRLAGGGGVDGAIHRRGGPGIMVETQQRYPQGCATGDAVVTAAGQLPSRYVIHTVGPTWRGGQHGEEGLLASAYRRSLEIAAAQQCTGVAFPSLSTGAYGYPLEAAAPPALQTVLAWLQQQQIPPVVRFVLFDVQTYEAYATALRHLASQHALVLTE